MLKRLSYKTLFQTALGTALFFGLGVMSAFAAANDYTVSGGDLGALPAAGAASVPLNTITITDAGGDDFTNDPENIIITFNAAQYGNVVFDTSVVAGSLTIGGSCGYNSANALTYTSPTSVTIPVKNGTNCANGETITIAGLKIGTLYSAPAPGAANLILVDNGSTAAGSAVPSSTTINLTTAIGTLTSLSVSSATLASAATTTYSFGLTTSGVSGSPAIVNNGKIQIVFPASYNISGLNGTTTTVSGSSGTWTASVAGQNLTLTQSGGAQTNAGALSFSLNNVRNPSSTGSTGTFAITTMNSAGAGAQTGNGPALTILGASNSSSTFNDITGVTVTDEATGGVRIAWTDPVGDDTTTIQILKGTAPMSVNGTVYASVAKGIGYYVDTNVTAGDVVTYQLRPAGDSDNGDLTAAVTYTVGSGATTTTDETTTDEGTTTDETTTDEGTTDEGTTDETTTDETSTDETTTETTMVSASDMFSDEIPSWAETAITVLADAGVVEGNPDGTFGAGDYLNRAEAAALLWRVLMMGDPDGAVSAPFTDVGLNEWYTDYVASLQGLGLVDGNPDGSYEPAENINRAEFLKLAMNVYVYLMPTADVSAVSMTSAYVDLDTAAWYAQTVSAATEWGFVEGNACDGGMCFDAGDMITRAEASQILYNMFGASL